MGAREIGERVEEIRLSGLLAQSDCVLYLENALDCRTRNRTRTRTRALIKLSAISAVADMLRSPSPPQPLSGTPCSCLLNRALDLVATVAVAAVVVIAASGCHSKVFRDLS